MTSGWSILWSAYKVNWVSSSMRDSRGSLNAINAPKDSPLSVILRIDLILFKFPLEIAPVQTNCLGYFAHIPLKFPQSLNQEAFWSVGISYGHTQAFLQLVELYHIWKDEPKKPSTMQTLKQVFDASKMQMLQIVRIDIPAEYTEWASILLYYFFISSVYL